MPSTQLNPMQQAAAVFDNERGTGGQSELARQLDVRQQSVQRWCTTGRPPADRCIQIESLTGISRYRLRPDVFGARGPRKPKA